jgi:hypothetical protein
MTKSPVRLPSEPEVLRNIRMGFRHGWEVSEAYEVVPFRSARHRSPVRVLRAVEARGFRRFYLPMIEPNLVEEFAQVDTEEKLKRFVVRYGLLGFQHVTPPEERVGGDPVEWALARAKESHVVLVIQNLLEGMQKVGSDAELRRELPKLLRKAGLDTRFRLVPNFDAGRVMQELRKQGPVSTMFQLPKPWEDDPARTAWLCLGDIINPHLRRIHFEIRPGDETDSPNLMLRFDCLLNVIFWRLAVELKKLKPYICESCGALKFARRGSRKTCSMKCRKKKWRSETQNKRKKKRSKL